MMKNCVISAVGKSSLHKEWTRGDCHFDLHLVVYDDSYGEFVADTPFVCSMKGYKLKVVYQYLLSNPELLEAYEYFFIPDDDILMDSDSINALFGMMRRYGLKIAQPSLVNSYYLWGHTLRDPYCALRYTNFVEMMVPCFSREALGKVLFTFNENETGWGTETHWPSLVHASPNDMAIIDAVSVVHTRPIRSGQAVHRHEAMEYLRKHGLTTRVREYGHVPVEDCGAFLLDRATYGRMVGLLKKQLPKVFCSDSMGMDGYAGYLFLVYVLWRATQSRQYLDMAMTMFGQTPSCWDAPGVRRGEIGEFIRKAGRQVVELLDSYLAEVCNLTPMEKAYKAYRNYRLTQKCCFCVQMNGLLGTLGLEKMSFQEQLMLADILLNNQMQVHGNS